jgi:hypothetical protein
MDVRNNCGRRTEESSNEIYYMINPSENEFTKDEPLTAPPPPFAERDFGAENEALQPGTENIPPSSEVWQQTKEKMGQVRTRTEFFLRENPVPTIIAALGVGLAIGWALRHAISSEEKEVETKSPVGNLNWSFLSLPFLWPFFKTVKERYDDSAESIKGGVSRLKKLDITPYTKPIRKQWKAWTD